jgi:pullulanase/glycogen debranching enzyme
LAATGVQIAGALDDLHTGATRADLGPTFHKGRPTLAVWAPTAQNVSLELDGSTVRMKRDAGTGVWSVTGPKSWKNKPYRYVVTVWAPSVRKVVTNKVTDPYSVALTADSERSLVVDLDDKSLAPSGWSGLEKPAAVPLKDAQIQELHIRDFSVADRTAAHPGTYLAFTDKDSDGSRHLRELAEAGTSYVHLLPAFDIATIPERKADQATVDCDLASYPADSDQQQACVAKAAAKDAYNWGYDPYHYTVPEGSYATDPDGTARTVEFRKMVKALNDDGLRVVMDVVYNHTAASGQAETSEQHLLCQHRHRERHDGQAGRRLGRHLGQGVQGRRLPLRPHGPPPEGQRPRRAQGPRRADRGEGRRRRQEDHPLRRGLELRGGRRRRPVPAGHAEEHGGDGHRDLLRPRP